MSNPEKWERSSWNDDPYATAKKFGLSVVLPNDNELMIDCDSRHTNHVDALMKIMESTGVVKIIQRRVTTSRTGNKHVYLTLDRVVTPLERIALQAALGSDAEREMYSLMHLFKGDPNPTLFFEVLQ